MTACSPEIGDACGNALDCSASGTRLCDLTQPRGYCTLEGCEEDTCPGEAVCVQFGRRIDGEAVARVSRSFCMYKCDDGSDCREDEGYACFSSSTFGATNEAQVLGNSKQKFCAPLPPMDTATPPERDAGMSMMSGPDTGVSDPDDAGMSLPEDSAVPDDDAGASE